VVEVGHLDGDACRFLGQRLASWQIEETAPPSGGRGQEAEKHRDFGFSVSKSPECDFLGNSPGIAGGV
jgi:hypothetical protein